MAIYRLTLEPYSAFRTPLQSDTIFGHLLWALRYRAGAEGRDRLEAFLARYRQGPPPLLVSAGFPEGTLPAPALREAPSSSGSVADRVVEDLLRKVAAELDYLPLAYWQALAAELSPEKLREVRRQLRERLQQYPAEDYRPWSQDQALTRTAIDRVTGQAREGRLFVTEETFYAPPARFDIWHNLLDESLLPDLKRWWEWLALNGFGRRKSAGNGAFRITRLLEPAGELLPRIDAPNGFVSLSAWVPAEDDPPEVIYRTLVKRGKLAEQWALPSPWKKPLVMFEPGAVACLPAGQPLREWYGRLAEEMHYTEPGIIQYGFGFPLGVRLVTAS